MGPVAPARLLVEGGSQEPSATGVVWSKSPTQLSPDNPQACENNTLLFSTPTFGMLVIQLISKTLDIS